MRATKPTRCQKQLIDRLKLTVGNKKSAESIAAAMAMDKHGQDSVTEISVISATEVKANAS